MKNKNKIAELEKKIEISSELTSIMDVFSMALDEMKKSFGNIFTSSSKNKEYFITSELEKFEKTWLSYLNSDSPKNE